MAAEVSAGAGLSRLADQLQRLSELTETLTVRLLELEEKVVALDDSLQSVHKHQQQSLAAAQHSEQTLLRLEETEDRLSRLEPLLAGVHADSPAARHTEELFADAPHFPEEDVEQPFLDEPGLFALEAIESEHGDGLNDGPDEAPLDDRLTA